MAVNSYFKNLYCQSGGLKHKTLPVQHLNSRSYNVLYRQGDWQHSKMRQVDYWGAFPAVMPYAVGSKQLNGHSSNYGVYLRQSRYTEHKAR